LFARVDIFAFASIFRFILHAVHAMASQRTI
jgi:hypothetical protein